MLQLHTNETAVEKSAKDAENAIKRYPDRERQKDLEIAHSKSEDSERNDEIPVKAGGTSLEEKAGGTREPS